MGKIKNLQKMAGGGAAHSPSFVAGPPRAGGAISLAGGSHIRTKKKGGVKTPGPLGKKKGGGGGRPGPKGHLWEKKKIKKPGAAARGPRDSSVGVPPHRRGAGVIFGGQGWGRKGGRGGFGKPTGGQGFHQLVMFFGTGGEPFMSGGGPVPGGAPLPALGLGGRGMGRGGLGGNFLVFLGLGPL